MEQSSIYTYVVHVCTIVYICLYNCIFNIETCNSLINQLQSLKTLESVTLIQEKKGRRVLIEEQPTRLGIFRDSTLIPTFLKPT